MLNYNRLPEALRGGMRRYVEDGIRPGHFLTAVLENDLVNAFSCADESNTARMKEIVSFLYNELPMRSYGVWGSPEAVSKYMREKQEEREGEDA